MEKTIFEQMGGTYTQQGDCYLPNLVLPTEKETRPIGVWGQRHLRYLKECHRITYANLLTSGNQMERVGQINNIRICATEIVNQVIIFGQMTALK